MSRREDIQKAIQNGVNEVFSKVSKQKRTNWFENIVPMSPEEQAQYRKEMAIAQAQRDEEKRIFRLTHKTHEEIRLFCPRCARAFEDVRWDEHIQDYEDHVKSCVVDCTGCDSFESEERCPHCYTYSLWAERIQDGTHGFSE